MRQAQNFRQGPQGFARLPRLTRSGSLPTSDARILAISAKAPKTGMRRANNCYPAGTSIVYDRQLGRLSRYAARSCIYVWQAAMVPPKGDWLGAYSHFLAG